MSSYTGTFELIKTPNIVIFLSLSAICSLTFNFVDLILVGVVGVVELWTCM